MTKDDVLIQLGDFGWIWHQLGNNKEQEYWLDWLAEKKFTLAVVPGNHENYDIIENLPTEIRWGNPVWILQRKKSCIYILQRGYIYNINNRKIFTCGGAVSIDKEYRIPHQTWWPQEELTYSEEKRGLDQLDAVKWEVDFVLTHTCPSRCLLNFFIEDQEEIFTSLSKVNDPVSKYLDFIDNRLTFKEWHFGHLHKNKRYIDEGGDIYQCHYNDKPYELE